MPRSGGALASRPHAKREPTRNQGPDNARIWRRNRGRRGRDIELLSDPQWVNPPGDDRDLGAVQGRQRGERTVKGNGGIRRNVAQGAGTSGGGWRVRGTSRWAEFFTRRRGGEKVKNERASTRNGYGWGVSRKEGETNNTENGRRKRWGGRSSLKV